MTKRPVRFAILGFGHHAVRRLVPSFPACAEATLVGMWRRDTAAAAKQCAELGIARCYPTKEALCADSEVDAVFITSPDAMHKDDALLALQHGKAVLCEKPVAMNATEAREMAAAARAAGVLYGAAQNFRYNRSVEWLRDQIAAGRIGEPQLAHAEFAYPAQTAPRRWITDPALACGGPIADVGVHLIDALRYVLGAEVKSVMTLARRDAMSGEVEAMASMQLEMTKGVLASATVSARASYRTLLEVTGSEAVLLAENGLTVDRPVDLVLRRAGAVVETLTVENSDGYTRMLDAFAMAFRGEGEFAASGEDAIRNMDAIDAAFASWKSGQRQTV